MEFGGISRFDISDNNAHRILVEFGYVMANTPMDFSNPTYFFSKYTGRPVQEIVDANLLTHFLNAGLLYEFSPTQDDRYNFYLGAEVNQLLAWSFVVEYLDGNSEEPLQEINTSRPTSTQDVVQRYYNLRWGMDVSMYRPAKHDIKLYLNFIHQINRRPYFPAGFAIGLKFYFGARR
jgi:hypothetical protein